MYATLTDWPDGNQTLTEHDTQDSARQHCTDVLEHHQPQRVSLLVKDGGEYRVCWSVQP